MKRLQKKSIAALSLSIFFAPLPAFPAQSWGGSVGVTSDYLVRGISRSDHAGALQADIYSASDSGLIGGLSASTTRISADDHRNAELSAFVGFAWSGRRSWRARILASHYSYPWNDVGSHYNYDELSINVGFREWLDLDVVYLPNAPRYVKYVGLVAVSERSAELNFRTPSRHGWAGAAGIGYADLSGPDGTGYMYWSAGGVYDLAPWSLSLSYVSTNSGGKYLYYDAAAHNRVTATVIWRF